LEALISPKKSRGTKHNQDFIISIKHGENQLQEEWRTAATAEKNLW
jgi:hypothetical protein